MSISKEDAKYVADLARLTFNDSELDEVTGQLNAILDYMEKLNELDTSAIEPTSHVLEISNVLREDEVRSSWEREQMLRNAPEEDEGYYKVPAVLEE